MKKANSQEIELTIYIDKVNGSWQIMAMNKDSESVVYGIEHSFDEVLDEQFLPQLREYLLARQEINNKIMKMFNIDGFSDDGTRIIRNSKKEEE